MKETLLNPQDDAQPDVILFELGHLNAAAVVNLLLNGYHAPHSWIFFWANYFTANLCMGILVD